jgi:hypothetical protein
LQRKRRSPTLGDQLKRKTKMPFGKKFVEKFGTDKTIEVSVANIEAAVVSALYAMKLVPERVDVLTINWQDLINKKPTDVISMGIKVRKE